MSVERWRRPLPERGARSVPEMTGVEPNAGLIRPMGRDEGRRRGNGEGGAVGEDAQRTMLAVFGGRLFLCAEEVDKLLRRRGGPV